jgi:hypothetical protein
MIVSLLIYMLVAMALSAGLVYGYCFFTVNRAVHERIRSGEIQEGCTWPFKKLSADGLLDSAVKKKIRVGQFSLWVVVSAAILAKTLDLTY